MRGGKVQYLEGLRGIAAMQVVLMHFVIGFMPRAEYAWPPLPILFDGHTAVYVFFLISGAVLTPSFTRPGPFITKLGKRVVRLAIPVVAAAAIATALIAVMPHAHGTAAALTGSKWLAMDSSGAPTFEHLAREIGLDSLLLGYREATLFMPLASLLTPMEHSLDAPFWSLHLELYGSLLVLSLVTLRGWSPRLHRIAIAVCAVTFGTHPMFLFVLGHLLPPALVKGGKGERASRLPGSLLLLLGLALSATKNWPILEPARAFLAHTELAAAPTLFQFQSQLAAVALFLGVRHARFLWPALQSAPLRYLGRLSFSIYLLHFPILFTVICLVFTTLPSVPVVFALFLALTLLAAIAFQRWIDAPAIALSHRLDAQRRNAVTSASASSGSMPNA
jgi:peptidoglycan/LPS O-acetylase OafA/YrhL